MDIKERVEAFIKQASVRIEQKKPEIMLAVGSGLIVGGTVLACRQTLVVDSVLQPEKEKIEAIKKAHEINAPLADGGHYNDNGDRNFYHDMLFTSLAIGKKAVKLYLPAVGMEVAGFFLIGRAFGILKDRNIAISAVAAASAKQAQRMWENAKERYGEEVANELKYNVKTEVAEEKKTTKDGKEKIVRKKVKVAKDPFEHSPFTKFYDETCTNYTDNPQLNRDFLEGAQDWFTHKLQLDKFVFLNEVYSYLGIPETQKGHNYGWYYMESLGPDHPHNKVDFGIYTPMNHAFINGEEPHCWLDFQVHPEPITTLCYSQVY